MFKHDLLFDRPLMNAAGTLGFALEPRSAYKNLLGAFITNPISPGARTPAHTRCCLPYPGGFLLHTGHPNPGLRAVVRRCAARWKRSDISVIVHLLAQRSEEIVQMVRTLEAVEGVVGIEVGLPSDVKKEIALAMVSAAFGELQVIARLPLERAAELAPVALQAGAAAVTLGAPRGALPGPDGEIITGRLYGPAIFPIALQTVRLLSRQEIPVIGAGGIYNQAQVTAMLEAGALAVQLDSVLWKGFDEPVASKRENES